MIRMLISVIALVACILIAGCGSFPPVASSAAKGGDDPSMFPELRAVLHNYETAWAAKDAKALAELFAEDGFVLSSGSPPVRGRANIEKHYAGAGGPLALRALAWSVHRDIGYIIGEYAQDSTFTNPGKFTLTLVWDEDSDRWLIFSDMDNGNTPPQPRPSPSATSPTTP